MEVAVPEWSISPMLTLNYAGTILNDNPNASIKLLLSGIKSAVGEKIQLLVTREESDQKPTNLMLMIGTDEKDPDLARERLARAIGSARDYVENHAADLKLAPTWPEFELRSRAMYRRLKP